MDYTMHSAVQTCTDVQDICDPLRRHLNIDYFNFIRQYHNHQRISLNTAPEWVVHFCREKLYLGAPFEDHLSQPCEGMRLWGELQHTPVYEHAKNHYDIQHGASLVECHSDYTDYYHFGHKAAAQLNSEDYVRRADLLKKFALYFKDHAHDLISSADWLHFAELDDTPDETTRSDAENAFLNSLDIKKYRIAVGSRECYLTQREFELCKYIIRDLTASDIAMICNITPRTVNAHINNIKEKLGCDKLSQLTYVLGRSSLAELLEQR